MGAFAAALVRRYGPNGTFWDKRPKLLKLPITSWQVWNEPNLERYWASGPDAGEYVRLLRTVSKAIKEVDPRAEVVTAGIPESASGVPLRSYLAAMYRAGASSAFDTLAIHPYARDSAGVLNAVRVVRGLMSRFRDRSPIWVTEVGWASDGPPSEFTVGEAGQADRIADTVDGLARLRSQLGIRGFVYFNWRDSTPYSGGTDFWGLHTGLLRRDGTPKPAFAAYQRSVKRIR
jgi:exo-beta-1,3-glucanase (GH17 family)